MDNYLRKYKILVKDKDTDNIALDVSDLRCTFVIEKKAIQSVNYASIAIYNLSRDTEAAVIREGSRVMVEAGYENGVYGNIFDGELFQPMRDRENVVDYKLSLHCIDGMIATDMNFINKVLEAGYNYKETIIAMAKNTRTPIPMGHISEDIKTGKSIRGKVIFGDWRDKAREIALDNGAQFYINDGKLQFMKVTDTSKGQSLVISPENGLIGTPVQTEHGFNFRCLLNPNIQLKNPCMSIKLDNSFIQQQKATQGEYISMLDQDMYGIVIGVTHTGDTRGQEWYTDAVCVNRGGKAPLGLAEGYIPPDFVMSQKENTN